MGLHIEVEAKETLGNIHQNLNHFRQKVQKLSPRIREEFLNIHIEPYRRKKELIIDPNSLKKRIQELYDKNEVLHNPHGIQVFTVQSGFFVSLHCSAQPDLTIEEVHSATNTLEESIMKEIPGQSQIYIYVEPHPIE